MTAEEYRNESRLGLRSYLLESPLSWLLPVLLGTCAAALVSVPDGVDPFDAFLTFLLSGNSAYRVIAGCLFCAGIIAVFTSTADALLCAIGYAFSYDIRPQGRPTTSTPKGRDATIDAGRRFMAVSLGLVVIGFILLDMLLRSGQQLLGVFFAFFTPMVAFSPAILVPALSGRRAGSFWATLSIVCGAAAGIGIGVYSVFGDPDLQWRAAPISFALAWSLYIIGLVFNGIDIEARPEDAI